MTHTRPSRRDVLRTAAALAGACLVGGARDVVRGSAGRFSIGACDWSIGMRGRTGALALAKQLGLDGAQVSMGSVENDLHLRRPDVQRSYRDAAEASGTRVAGIALDVMNQVPYKSDPRAEQWVRDSVDVASALGVRVVLLAFFERGDLRNDADGQAEVIRRLKRIAPRAEERGVILGIESWLSAVEHLRIIDAVGSKHVQVYYDVANSTQMGYDIHAEIRQLGRERICEFHAKENGFLLGQGRIDFAALRKTMDAVGYSGWIQIEGAVPKGTPMLDSYVENARFMRAHFT
ncbi:MAG: sugar phosphate isomerase/epimerase [Acidobacteriota bacterium]|nr:sugar phosphate isomerase/epimerase [Acidobacteriota bacterium]